MAKIRQSCPQAEEPDTNQQDAQAETAPAESTELELPKVDLMEVVEKWQAGLAKEYGISGYRLLILPVEADEYSGESLEVWFVPPDAKLPNPFAKEEEVVIEDEAMETEQPNQN